jgi:putative transposase
MHASAPAHRYNHRSSTEIISCGVWLYFRFCRSDREGEELLCARGIIVTDAAIRKGCCTFGQSYANELRRRCPRAGDRCHLDGVFRTIYGARHYLWRAVDQERSDGLSPARQLTIISPEVARCQIPGI